MKYAPDMVGRVTGRGTVTFWTGLAFIRVVLSASAPMTAKTKHTSRSRSMLV